MSENIIEISTTLYGKKTNSINAIWLHIENATIFLQSAWFQLKYPHKIDEKIKSHSLKKVGISWKWNLHQKQQN